MIMARKGKQSLGRSGTSIHTLQSCNPIREDSRKVVQILKFVKL